MGNEQRGNLCTTWSEMLDKGMDQEPPCPLIDQTGNLPCLAQAQVPSVQQGIAADCWTEPSCWAVVGH